MAGIAHYPERLSGLAAARLVASVCWHRRYGDAAGEDVEELRTGPDPDAMVVWQRVDHCKEVVEG